MKNNKIVNTESLLKHLNIEPVFKKKLKIKKYSLERHKKRNYYKSHHYATAQQSGGSTFV